MKKITIEHVKGYFGTDLTIKNSNTEMPLTGAYLDELSDPLFGFDNSFKPLLYPVSSLIEFREDLGFAPIIELAKLSFSYLDFKKIIFKTDSAKGAYSTTLNKILGFTFDSNDNSFVAMNKGKTVCVPNQLLLFQKLYEWHIDIHGLIEQGLAIDKSKLK